MAEVFIPPENPSSARDMPDLDDMPSEIRQVMRAAIQDSRGLIGALELGEVGRAEWHEEQQRLLARYHGASFGVGVGHVDFTPFERQLLGDIVAGQLKFLEGFNLEVQDSETFRQGWKARTDSYAMNIQQSWHRGSAGRVPFMPALPGEGTQCRSRCKCKWEVVELDGEAGDYDLYWRLGASRRHCQTCPARATAWSPYQIRNGVPA